MKKTILAIVLFVSAFASAQNVGIGTIAPQSTLHVKSIGDVEARIETETANSSSILKLQTNGNPANNIRLRKWAAGTTGTTYGIPLDNLTTLIAAAQAGGFMIGTEGNSNLHFITGGIERLRITGDGRMGYPSVDPYYTIAFKNHASDAGTFLVENTNTTGTNWAIAAQINSPVGAALSGISGSTWTGSEPTRHGVIGGTSDDGIGVGGYAGNGNAIAVRAKANSGVAIHSTGRLRFENIGEAAGKVLTSDANGFATWQTLPSDNIWGTDGISAYTNVVGNVGIGTTSPGAKLELNHNSNTTLSLLLNDSSATGAGNITFKNRQANRFMGFNGYVAADGHSANYHLDIQTDSTFIATIKGDGKVGIGMVIPSEKLDVNGNIRASGSIMLNGGISFDGPLNISGYLGNAGQVLVSNGNSAPTWQNAANPNVGFKAELLSNQSVNNITNTALSGFSQHFNDGGGNFNASSGVYTVPSDGLYHIGINVLFSSPSSGNTPVFARLRVNGQLREQVNNIFPGIAGYSHSLSLTYVGKLFAGQQLHVEVYQESGTTLSIIAGGSSTFFGYKIY